MRRSVPRLIPIAILALATSFALAAGNVRYKWRDAQGNLHYSDALPPEAGVYGYEVIGNQGVVIKRVDPAKSPEALAAAKVEAAKQRRLQEESDRRTREDQQLLAANPTETDLLNSQQQQSQMIEQNINSARVGLQSQERSLAELLGRAAEFERTEKPIPAKLAQQIGETRKQIEAQHALIDRRVREREAARASFSAEIDRYRALIEKSQ
jgi:flagellar biosynthesis GTPase FlhF